MFKAFWKKLAQLLTAQPILAQAPPPPLHVGMFAGSLLARADWDHP
jgi:hypothetical protein